MHQPSTWPQGEVSRATRTSYTSCKYSRQSVVICRAQKGRRKGDDDERPPVINPIVLPPPSRGNQYSNRNLGGRDAGGSYAGFGGAGVLGTVYGMLDAASLSMR